MAANILNATFHVLHKESGQTDEATFEENEIQSTDNTSEGYQQLVDDICERYSGRGGKGYGYFESDIDNYPMLSIVSDYHVNGSKNFFDTTKRMIRVLTEKAKTEIFSTGGDVVFSHYQENGSEYILVAIVNETTGSYRNGWEIERTNIFDIKNLKFAGRIDLTAWQGGVERYISFLKGSGTVSVYFKKFLGCNETLMAVTETQKLVDVIKKFINEKDITKEEKEVFIESSLQYLSNLSDNEELFDPDVFSNAIWPTEPDELLKALNDEDVKLSSGFIPVKRKLKGLVTFAGTSKEWKIEFSRKALADGEITYDSEEKIIVIRSLPKKLIDSLEEEYQ